MNRPSGSGSGDGCPGLALWREIGFREGMFAWVFTPGPGGIPFGGPGPAIAMDATLFHALKLGIFTGCPLVVAERPLQSPSIEVIAPAPVAIDCGHILSTMSRVLRIRLSIVASLSLENVLPTRLTRMALRLR